jgi:hypothetical protein
LLLAVAAEQQIFHFTFQIQITMDIGLPQAAVLVGFVPEQDLRLQPELLIRLP